MIKFILLTILFLYIFSKLAKFFLKTVFVNYVKNAANQQQRTQQQQHKSSKEGAIHVDHIPEEYNQKKKDLGGDYVDYEIVK
jgi:hypothetical protein